MPTIVVDPGHGGAPGVIGPTGHREATAALDLAFAVADELERRGHQPVLTRREDRPCTAAARAALAAAADAAALVSLHFDHHPEPHVQGVSTWVHDAGGAGSRALAAGIGAELGRASGHAVAAVARAPLAVVDPRRLGPRVAAAHVEVSHLSDPAEEQRLRAPAYVATLGRAIAAAIDQAVVEAPPAAVDVWHEVPLVPQVTGMSCWAAAAAMLIGWRECVRVDPGEVARAAGRWQQYRDGLEPDDVEAFARTWGLAVERPGPLTVARLRELLTAWGPLWIGEASPGLHVVVVTGVVGDGSDDRTEVRIADPWPVGRGERYRLTVRQLAASHRAAALAAGAEPLLLRTSGRR